MKRLLMVTILFVSSFSASMCDRAPADTTTLSQSTTESVVTTTTTASISETSSTDVNSTTDLLTTTSTLTTESTLSTDTSVPATTTTTTTVPVTTTTTTTVPVTTTTVATTTTTTTTTVPTTTTTTTTTVPTTTTTTTTTVPTTTTTTTTTVPTTTTTLVDIPDTIAEILAQTPTGTVSVTGVVYYVIATPELPSYYVYDGTGTILVYNDSHPVTVGQGVRLEAVYDGQSPAPQLVNVTSFEESTVFTTLPEYVPATVADIISHPQTDLAFYGSTLRLTMTVDIMDTPFGSQVILQDDTTTAGFVVVNFKSFAPSGSNPYPMLDGKIVSVDAVIHVFEPNQGKWHVLTVSDPVIPPPFVPGEGGQLNPPSPTAPIPGQFSGFYLTEVGRNLAYWYENTPITDWVAEMAFPSANSLGGTGYILQYYDVADSSWKPLTYEGLSQPFDGTWDNLSLDLDTAYSLRLMIQGGAMDGYVSNTIDYSPVLVDSEFTSWGYSWGFSGGTNVMMPFAGFAIYDVYVCASNWSSGESVDVSQWVTIRWYRVDPVTFQMTLVPDVVGSEYITSSADAGYYIAFRAEGDGVHVGGYLQRIIQTEVSLLNPGYVSEASTDGFILHLYYAVDGMNPANFTIYDQDGIPLTLASVVALDNANYAITFADSTVTTGFAVSYSEGSWAVGFQMGFGGMYHYSEFQFFPLTE